MTAFEDLMDLRSGERPLGCGFDGCRCDNVNCSGPEPIYRSGEVDINYEVGSITMTLLQIAACPREVTGKHRAISRFVEDDTETRYRDARAEFVHDRRIAALFDDQES